MHPMPAPPLPETDDPTMALAVAEGDREAEAELYRRLAPRVRLYGLRHLRDPAAADDLAQDVLVMAFAKLREGEVREPERLASFVLGIARRLAAEHRRRRDRRQGLLDRFGDVLRPHRDQEPPEEEPRVAGCLQSLAERERTVVVLSFWDDRPAAEIADTLGMTSGNVRVVRHRALARLRRCLEESA